MKLPTNRILPWIIASLAIGLIILLIINIGRGQTPKIIHTTPINGSPSVETINPLVVQFDQDVDPLQITISSSPEENWRVTPQSANTLSLEHDQYLQSSTQYTINILSGEKILGSFSFTTAGGQGDPRYYQQVLSDLDGKYPLAAKTPYETNAYRLVYSSPMTLEIRRKNSVLSDQEIIEQVKEWVKSVGFDPNSHKYTVVVPTPTPSLNF